ncbi:MAG: SDR family oxidoreductase [Gammaproteobacteria bacterium]|nr:SDR family oxidoreductase [Gammaproteobacteria bacterium]
MGQALVRAFLDAGFRVAGLGRTGEPPDEMATLLSEDRFRWYQVDVADSASVEAAFARILRDSQRIDVLFNNAAVYPRTSFLETSLKDWVRTIEVNLLGAVYCIRAVLPAMMRTGYGRIFNVGSFADGSPIPRSSGYAVSKGGLHALSKAVAADIRDMNLDVQIHEWIPGHLKTRMSEYTGLDPSISASWAVKLVLEDKASSDSVLLVNDKEYVPPKRLKDRVLDLLRFRH